MPRPIARGTTGRIISAIFELASASSSASASAMLALEAAVGTDIGKGSNIEVTSCDMRISVMSRSLRSGDLMIGIEIVGRGEPGVDFEFDETPDGRSFRAFLKRSLSSSRTMRDLRIPIGSLLVGKRVGVDKGMEFAEELVVDKRVEVGRDASERRDRSF